MDFEGNYSCELHLKWLNPPCTLLLIKKIFDDDATRRFKEFTSWIVQVIPPTCVCVAMGMCVDGYVCVCVCVLMCVDVC